MRLTDPVVSFIIVLAMFVMLAVSAMRGRLVVVGLACVRYGLRRGDRIAWTTL